MNKTVWIDGSSYTVTGRFSVIKDAWDEQGGNHYEEVASFEAEEEAQLFVDNYDKEEQQ